MQRYKYKDSFYKTVTYVCMYKANYKTETEYEYGDDIYKSSNVITNIKSMQGTQQEQQKQIMNNVKIVHIIDKINKRKIQEQT